MKTFARPIAFCVLTVGAFTLSSCADRVERFEARQELKIARIERQQDRLAAEEQRRLEKQERE